MLGYVFSQHTPTEAERPVDWQQAADVAFAGGGGVNTSTGYLYS